METSEILKKVRQIEIKTRGLSNNIFAGQYHSAFKGRGMSFSEVREYQFGDDIRDIDWNVTARFNKPYVKVFEEERELTVMLMVDVSGSLEFGTIKQLKKDMVTEIAATLAFSAIQNNDKIGVIFFSDRIEKFIPPKKGRKHILYIIRELIDFQPESRRTNIRLALEYLTNVMKRRCTAFILSDFIDQESFKNALTIANRKHDVVALQVYDRRVSDLPPVGLMRIKDAETGHEQWIDTSSKAVRRENRDWWTPERTFWEKATILHHEANRPEHLEMPQRYSRHYYDLYRMAATPVKEAAFSRLDLLKKVVDFKMKFYPRSWAKYPEAVPGTLKLLPPEYRFAALEADYNSMQDMLYGDVPTFETVIAVVQELEKEINTL